MRQSSLVYLVFVLSGAAGLIYEIVWARQLVLVFGNTTQAVSAILTGFFGGMAIGSVAGGRIADRARSPLRMYGLLELALVAVVIATPVTFRLLHEVYRGAYAGLEGSPFLVLIRFALALLALAPATILMGATLPTLTRHLSAGRDHLSRAFGRLYAVNTLGAIAGTLLAGLVLIELVGLTGALLMGAACSAVAGLVAIVLATRGGSDQAAASPARDATQPSTAPRESAAAARPSLALLVAFVSGLTSLGYQVLWTRLLASGTGGSTYVFTMILAVFLAGIAIGALAFSLLRPRIGDPVGLLAGSQVAVALLALGGLVGVIAHPRLVDAYFALDVLGTLWGAVVPVVLPATIVMGLAFPASSALLEDRDGRVATAAGGLLAANTIGAICGTFLVPFVAIPAIGSPSAVVLLALVNVATAAALAAGRARAPLARLGLTAAAGATGLVLVTSLMRPGLVVDPSVAQVGIVNGVVEGSAEDEIASVQAGRRGSTKQLWVTGNSMTVLTVDAKLMAIVPLMLRPESQSVLNVAFGMGTSYRTALRAGLDVEAIELVPSVPSMFGHFYPDAAAVLADPRGRIVIADGRNHVELTERRYDIVITDPPPPIDGSGVSVISSREYYAAGRAHLNAGGVMMQWVPYGPTVDEFRAHVRTFRAVFPNVMVMFGPGSYGFLMLGSDAPLALDEAAMRAVLRRPGVLDDLASATDAPEQTEDGWVRRLPTLVFLQGQAVSRFVGHGPLITDDRPLPEYFLLRRLFDPPAPRVSRPLLADLAAGG